MRGHRRGAFSFVGIVAVVAAIAGGGIVPAGATAAKAPSITVTPHKGVKPGQTLEVSGTGFGSGNEVVVIECLAGTTDPSTCDLGNFDILAADAHGAFTTKFTVHRTLLGQTSFDDCLEVGCEVLASPAEIFDAQTSAPIAFDPHAPLPKTSLATKPATKLKDLQTLKVSGTGFSFNAGPADGIELIECIAAKLVCAAPASEPAPGANGKLATVYTVRREITTGPGTHFDCAKKAGVCELIALDELDVDYHATAPLAFDASVPPPKPPSLVVRPNTNLPFYARVTVTGEHWNANDPFGLMLECATSDPNACAFVSTTPQPDAGGAFQVAPLLQRDLTSFVDPGGKPIDCAKASSKCYLMFQDSVGDSAVAPLSFDPKSPVPPPAKLRATPAPPYQDQEVLHLKGVNFPPSALFQVSQCENGPDGGGCLTIIGGPAQATTAQGKLATDFQIEKSIPDFGITCSKTTQCYLEVDSEAGVSATLPLTFGKGGGGAARTTAHARLTPRPRSAWLAAATSRTAMARAAIARPKVTSATQ